MAAGSKQAYDSGATSHNDHAMPLASNHFIDLMENFEGTNAIAGAWGLLLDYGKEFGFSFGIVSELPHGSEQLCDIALCAAVPPQWRERYSRESYHHRDPIVLHAPFLRRPYSWAEAAAHPRYSKAQRRIIEERREFSIMGGFTAPVVWRNNTAIVSLCGENPILSRPDRLRLHAGCVFALSRMFALSQTESPADLPPLSGRERECLAWASAGKSDRQIGEILSLSEKTVSTYIQRAKMHFGVSTRIQAVICAIKDREIDL
jgi:LuxR family quorum sensing-dependent transcriptional regulator